MNWALPSGLSRWLIAGIFGVLIIGTRAFAQQPDTRDYDSEEDLWEALREGEITYADYIDLLETSRVGTDNVLVPVSDWEELPGSDAGYLMAPDTTDGLARPASRATRDLRGLRWSWRSGYKGDLAAPGSGDGYAIGRFRGSNFAGLIDWKHDSRSGRWQRRVFEGHTHGISLQTGNVEPRFGRGLVVGRRSRLIGTTQTNRPDGDWWQPSRSRFNGLWLSTVGARTVSADLLVSDIRSTQLVERVVAGQLTAGTGIARFGLTGLNGDIRRRDSAGVYVERIVGGHIRVGRSQRVMLAEIAVAQSGATAKTVESVWQFDGGLFHARAWSYAPEFVNPWGGGPGHSDTRTFLLERIGETYTSRTAGERGFSLATRLDPRAGVLGGQFGSRWEWMTHREAPHEPVQHAWTVRLQWERSKITLRPYARGAVIEGQPSRHAIGSLASFGTTDHQLSARAEFGRHNVNGARFIRAGLGAKWRLSAAVRLEPTVRWFDPDLDRAGDGYWYLYFTEVIFPVSAWRVEAALVWQRYERRGRGDDVELRLRMVAGQT